MSVSRRRTMVAPEGRIYPGSAIVPILRFDPKTGETKNDLLGTGFFISERDVLMSVKHVLGVKLEPGEAMGVHIAPLGGGRGFIYRVGNVRTSDKYDLAVADVPDAEGFQVLQ